MRKVLEYLLLRHFGFELLKLRFEFSFNNFFKLHLIRWKKMQLILIQNCYEIETCIT
jgi:hypothetical protein